MERPISEEEQKQIPDFSERNHFVTVGTFKHEPNYQSILYLKNTLWGLIRAKLPKAELHIFGAHVTQRVQQLHNPKTGIFIKGFVEDIQDTLKKYKVFLAPLQFGAGLKGKLVDAMKSGTPCVMSSIAAEGMFGDLSANGFIEDEPTNFAQKAIEIYTINKIYSEFQINGFQIINSIYNKYNFNELLFAKIIDLKSKIHEHRLQNFIGTMLRYHTMQSSKYMSKWIESKNK